MCVPTTRPTGHAAVAAAPVLSSLSINDVVLATLAGGAAGVAADPRGAGHADDVGAGAGRR